VRVKQSAHVYSFEAVNQMNIKAKHWKDLTTSESFTKEDILTLQVWQLLLSQRVIAD